MSLPDDQQQLRADIDKTRIEYLLTDADVALTFIAMARDPLADDCKRARLRGKANKAYRDIVHLTRNVAVDEPMLEQLRNKLHDMRSALKELGEPLSRTICGSSTLSAPSYAISKKGFSLRLPKA